MRPLGEPRAGLAHAPLWTLRALDRAEVPDGGAAVPFRVRYGYGFPGKMSNRKPAGVASQEQAVEPWAPGGFVRNLASSGTDQLWRISR